MIYFGRGMNMLHVKFSKDVDNRLIISDYNDEQLYVVAQALMHEEGRNKLELLINSAALPHDYTAISYTKEITISVMPLDAKTVMLKLEDKNELNDQTDELTIEIAIDTLEELIAQWQDKDFENLSHLFLTRQGDVYTLSEHKTNL